MGWNQSYIGDTEGGSGIEILGGASGRGDRGRDGDGELGGKDTVAFNTIGTEPTTPLDYALGSEHNHSNTSKLGGHGGQLEIQRTNLN